MPDIVISNSTCLIGLERIGRLDILLKLYSEIAISEAVPWKKQIAGYLKA